MKRLRSTIAAISLIWTASALLPGVTAGQDVARRNRWKLGVAAVGLFPGGETYSDVAFGIGAAISGSYHIAPHWEVRGEADVSAHACAESADAIPFAPSTDIGCSYASIAVGPAFRLAPAAAFLSPFLGARVDVLKDLSTDGFGLGAGVTSGLTLEVSDRIGIESVVSGVLARFRRTYRYWEAGVGWRERGTWQWGRLLSFSLGAQVAIR